MTTTVFQDAEGVRWYHDSRVHPTPLPSVTSILHATMPAARRQALAAWEARLGEDAVAGRDHAASRGTCHHAMIEAQIHGWPEGAIADRLAQHHHYAVEEARSTHRSVAPFLARIKRTFATELPVMVPAGPGLKPGHGAGFAGTVDWYGWLLSAPPAAGPGAAQRDEWFAVVDWKTANQPKDVDAIGDYRVQVAAYAGGLNLLARRRRDARAADLPPKIPAGRVDFIRADGTLDGGRMTREGEYHPTVERGVVVVATAYGEAQVFEMDRGELVARWHEWLARLERFWKDRAAPAAPAGAVTT